MTETRHATTEELLAARDGEGSDWTRAHLMECRSCSAELFDLEQMRARLRSLPYYAPPRDRWSAVAALARAETRRRRWYGGIGVAAAAVLTALTFAALRPGSPSSGAAEQAALEREMMKSRALEQALRSLEPERRALPAEAARVAAELEQRLSRLDARLAEPEAWLGDRTRRLEMWRERAGLMGALVDVHAMRVAAAGL